ncbi:MAG: HEPN domain-containing protein [Spirochaetes bacterium]|nr:HEPN domain-containing protein [Spirochaetota bacterium]
MEITGKTDYWTNLAIDDLDSAGIMLEKKKYLQSGFYCHQTIEKILKAYYWHNRAQEPPYTHNLMKLAEAGGLIELLTGEHKRLMDILMPLNIEARYPDNKLALLKTLTQSRSTEIHRQTTELFLWMRSLIEK